MCYFFAGDDAAGMCAALGVRTFLRQHHIPDAACRSVIAECHNRIGIKIRILGSRQLKPSFFEPSNETVRPWLCVKGVQTYKRENGRIFPCSGRADDVLYAFETLLAEHDIELLLKRHIHTPRQENSAFIASANRAAIRSDFLMIATGGLSSPKRVQQQRAWLCKIVQVLGLSHCRICSDLSFRSVALIAESPAKQPICKGNVYHASGEFMPSMSFDEVAEASQHSSVSMFVDL